MVDRSLAAKAIADVRDAIQRIRDVLPADVAAFLGDRTAREVVVLNLFIALQQCIDLAAHWLADAGRTVPPGYREVFTSLADDGVIDADLASRLATAAGFRNLVAHRYGVLDWERVHAIASGDLGDLEAFCAALAEQIR